MRSRLSPTTCLEFESDEAKNLIWLPLAVRFKLDEASVRLGLRAWQSLPYAERLGLLSLPSGADFRNAAILAGATPHMAPSTGSVSVEAIAEAFGCDLMSANSWFVESSPFSRYVLAKRLMDRIVV